MSKMMKAAVQEAPNKLVVKEVPVPEINDNEVLIKVKYTGICGTDHSIYSGKYSAEFLPMIPGHEFSGIVEEVGGNAEGIKKGDRVTADINMSCGHCFYCLRGQKLMCSEFTQLGIHTNGSYAEYVKVPWGQVHILPDSLSMLRGAYIEPLSCVIHSAKAAGIEMASSVAIIGSGLGIPYALLAQHLGATKVILIARNKQKLEMAHEMGVDHVVSVHDVDDPVAHVKEMTEGRGADTVVEMVGTSATYETAWKMVRPGGTLASFGITAPDDAMELKPFDVVLGERKIVGSTAGVGQDWPDAIQFMASGRIDPGRLFSKVVPLENLEKALDELKNDPLLTKVFVSPEVSEEEILNK
ncbi:MAG: alcohol dehydrogenase catalytic domain-containing protein [Spirochaetales bacterium]|nr:alcohol dehydrogenase catalytic domain-containing protein [Spirochaetales bacterium]MCF7937495.1 alcohol dehydrogenase catalytic domain-containing protein [Spirochaetales bacterium]